MAKCRVCGRWAGLFKGAHDDCVMQPPAAALPPAPHTDQASVGFAFGKDFPPPVVIRTERPYRKHQAPQLHAVLMALLKRAQVADVGHWTSANLAAKLVNPDTLRDGERSFVKWCRTEESGIGAILKPWPELIFWAGHSLDAAEQRAAELLDVDPEEAAILPYFNISSFACRVSEHAALHGFIALRSDPVWSYLWPPNDWLCSCVVTALPPEEVPNLNEAKNSGMDRIDNKILTRSLAWYQQSPRAAIKVLST